MLDGFARIKQHLEKLGRPVTALAACELRSPKPMSVAEFQEFNREYLKTLHEWGCRARRDQCAGAQQHRADHRGAVRLELLRLHLHGAGSECVRRLPDLGPAGDQARRARGRAHVRRPRRVAEGSRREGALCRWTACARASMRSAATGAASPHRRSTPCTTSARCWRTCSAELKISQIGVAWYPGWPPVSDMEFEVDVRRVRTELVI